MPTISVGRIIAIASLGAAAALNSACGHEAHGAATVADAAVPVRVVAAARANEAIVTATGTLGAKDEIPLSFKIGGIVAAVSVDEGAHVRAGQPLATLDLREIDAAVAKANAGAEKAIRDADRAERLYHDSVTTLAQWQDAVSARDAAAADLRAARVNREFAVINAPNDGVILRRVANPGTQVSAGSQVLVLGSAARGSVLRVGLADRDAVRVRAGDEATIEFDAYPGREFHGRVRLVGAAADPRTGTYVVEILVDGGDALPNGLVGRASIGIPAAESHEKTLNGGALVAIPAEALVDGAADSGVVYTLDAAGHRALRHEVTLVGVNGDRVLVSGIEPHTSVITAGAAWLRDSVRVEVKP